MVKISTLLCPSITCGVRLVQYPALPQIDWHRCTSQALLPQAASSSISIEPPVTFNTVLIQYSNQLLMSSMLFLKSENVPTINDRVGRVFASSGASYSTYELISASEKAGASGLLYITVDRPYSAWLKVTAKFYDIDGRVLWQEEAEKKSGITSAGSIEKVCHSIETKMLSHLATLVESHSPSETPRPPNVTVTDNPR